MARVIQIEDTSALKVDLQNHHIPHQAWTDIDLNRSAGKLNHAFMRSKGVGHPHTGFKWQNDDVATPRWYPQGIAGLRSAPREDAAHKYILVSWYGKGDYDNKGVRVSFVDVTDMTRVKYRHVLLVKPSGDSRVFAPITIPGRDGRLHSLHAGGLATCGDTLYVADTNGGIRAFDTRIVFSAVEDLPDKTRCGIIDGQAYAFDYRYILPQSAHYKMTMSQGDGDQNFSFAAMDWTDSDSPTLITGNYHSANYDNPPPKIVWWKLEGDRITEYDHSFTTDVERVQGAVSSDGFLWLSQSGGTAKLWRVKTQDRTSKMFTWPHGCEDLHCSRYSRNLWCLTEHPGDRFVFAVKLDEYA